MFMKKEGEITSVKLQRRDGKEPKGITASVTFKMPESEIKWVNGEPIM